MASIRDFQRLMHVPARHAPGVLLMIAALAACSDGEPAPGSTAVDGVTTCYEKEVPCPDQV